MAVPELPVARQRAGAGARHRARVRATTASSCRSTSAVHAGTGAEGGGTGNKWDEAALSSTSSPRPTGTRQGGAQASMSRPTLSGR